MNKMNAITIIGLILIFLGGIGGIILALGQARSASNDKTEIISTTKSENKELKQDILELKNERTTLNKILAERDKKINEQNSKIESLNNKLIEKSEYIEKYISGGNSYPIIELGTMINENNGTYKISLILKNLFELPIYNIIIEAYNYDEIEAKTFLFGEKKEKAIKLSDYVNSRFIEFKKDLFAPKTADSSLGFIPLDTYSLYIIIHTRNKALIQKIAVIKFMENYYSGFVVYDLLERKKINESKYEEYPMEIQEKLKEKLKNIPNNMKLRVIE